MDELRWGKYVRSGISYRVEFPNKTGVDLSRLEPQGILAIERWDVGTNGFVKRPQEETERIAKERGATIIAESHIKTRRLDGIYLLFSEKKDY
jgi:hypothetical protein